MNNAQQGTMIGAGVGLGAGFLASEALCHKGDSACRNTLLATGMAIGAAVGYLTGHERDLQIAQRLEADLRQQGYQTQIETVMVDTTVPVDSRTGREIQNDQVNTTPRQFVTSKPKRVTAMKSLTVVPKNSRDASERAKLSRELLASANQMSGKTRLIVPTAGTSKERQELAKLAREKNVLMREDRNASAITLAAL